MFGENPIMKKVANDDDGFRLHVVFGSPFLTIQGEGPYSGWPAVFIRLHGCNLACTFCDTQFSDPGDPVVPPMLLVNLVKQHPVANLVVVTGGEPLRQNILPLCKMLFAEKYVVQIETAGTLWWRELERYAQVVCSPKTPMIHPDVLRSAVAFKYVIDCEMKFDGFIPITATQAGARPARLAAPRPGAPVYLSPMDTGNPVRNRANRQLVGQLAMEHGCLAGVQLHKFLELA